MAIPRSSAMALITKFGALPMLTRRNTPLPRKCCPELAHETGGIAAGKVEEHEMRRRVVQLHAAAVDIA